jgi:HAMP domain-containing protein
MIRNMQIRSKLIAILITPLLALTVLAFIGIGTNVSKGVQADRVDQQTAFAVNLSQLVHELQQERDLSAGWVASGRGYGGVVSQREVVNQALIDFRRDAATVGPGGEGSRFREHVDLALGKLAQLNQERQRIGDGEVSVPRTLEFYSDVIDHLLAVDGEIASVSDDRALVRNVTTFVDLARLKEAASLERGFVFAVTSAGKFDPGEFQRFASILGAQDTWRSQFDATATPAQREALAKALESGDAGRVVDLRTQLLASNNAVGPVALDPRTWYRYATARIDLLRGVEQNLAADVAAASSTAQSNANRQALLYTIILTLVLWVTVGLSLLMARVMVGPLRTLTRTANEVADQRLPGLVDRLQQATDPRDLDVVPEPVPVTTGDEIGQVSTAFNSVHQVAIQVATEQAALRKSIGDMFLNLARRSQSLIDRQLELIDDLERNEADPDALENLFKLDHLATRMRRNSEDLIVLSGAEPARRWTQPVPLVDVVRAALAEIEDYNRVELLPIDDVGVAGQAVADVVHLLAELIENATSFSPPGTKVQVAGQAVSNGYVLEVEDRGLGMSDEELVEANERLANPPVVDFALSRMLGLYVVGRLAQRYRIKVQLRHSWYGGITALVLLPPNVVVRAVVDSLEAGPRRGRPELVSSTQPAEPPAEAVGDHLPIFEAARSDWFESGARGDHLPLRRHAAQQPSGRTAEPAGNGAGGSLASAAGAAARIPTPGPGPGGPGVPDGPGGPEGDGGSGRPPFGEPVAPAAPPVGPEARGPTRTDADRAPAPPPDVPRTEAPAGDAPPSAAGRADGPPAAARADAPPAGWAPASTPPAAGPLPTRTPGASSPPPAAPPPTSRRARQERPAEPPPAPVEVPPIAPSLQTASVQTTKAGLPRRVPRANLAPGMVAAKAAAATRPADTTAAPRTSSASRSPEEVRSMLSSYRSGIERGRMMAAGEDAVTGSDAPSSARSDDDATQ